MATLRLVLAHPRWTVAGFLLLTTAWLPALFNLQLATDGRLLFDPEHPALEVQDEISQRYGSGDLIVITVAADGPETLYTPQVLEVVARLSDDVQWLDGIDGPAVKSVSTVVSPRWSDDGLVVTPPLMAPPIDLFDAREVQRLVSADPLFAGFLVARDASALAIYAPLESSSERDQVVQGVMELRDRERERLVSHGESGATEIQVLGPALAEVQLARHVLDDLKLLLPLSLFVLAAFLWLWFRRLSIVVVGLAEAGTVIAWTMGIMALVGEPLTLVTVVLPVILTAYCVADSIHIGQRFLEKRTEGRQRSVPHTRAQDMEAAIVELLTPVAFTTWTTCAGFLAFAVTPIPPLRAFGLLTAAGVSCALVTSLLVVPAALLVLRFDGSLRSSRIQQRVVSGLASLSERLVRRPLVAPALVLLTTAATFSGVLWVEVQDSWLSNFNARSELVSVDTRFNETFSGSNMVNLTVETPAEDGVFGPQYLAALDGLEAALESMEEVGATLSVTDILQGIGRVLEGTERLPRSAKEAEEWALIFESAGGAQNLQAYVDDARYESNTWVFLETADFKKTAAVVAAVDGYLEQQSTMVLGTVRYSGDAYLGMLLVDNVTSSLLRSLVVALLLTFVVAWWMLGELGAAILAITPVTVAILWSLGLMGWMGVPLGVATSTFCAIALGIGIDFSLHWLARYRLARQRGCQVAAAVVDSATSCGGVILVHGFVVIAGFAVLLLSPVPPNRELSLLVSVSVAACVLSTMLLLPSAVGWLAPRRLRRIASPAQSLSPPFGVGKAAS